MPITSQKVREEQRRRVKQLILQGLTTKAICQRLGGTERQVYLARKALRDEKEKAAG